MKTLIVLITRAVLAIVGTGIIFENTADASVLSVNAGQAVKLSVTASGTQPFTYQWRKNGMAISGATNASYSITSTTTSDSATYTAVVTNAAGSTVSDDAVLTVNSSTGLTELMPASYSARGENTPNEGISKLFDGQAATKWLDFSGSSWVEVSFAKPTVLEAYSVTSANDVPARDPGTWTLSGSNDGIIWTAIETRTVQIWGGRLLTRDFVLAATTRAHTRYRFDFKATSGSVIQLAELELYGKTGPEPGVAPSITNQPLSLVVTEGLPASFSVTALGTATLAYQWFKNGTAISGATSATYTIATTVGADAANYSVTVANAAGSVTSATAELTVNAAISLVQLTPQSYSARGQKGTTESIAQLFDGNSATKWLDYSATSWVSVVFSSPTVLEAYSLTSANDVPGRDPASWTLSGSNDGSTWTVIETRTAQTWASRSLARDFVLAAPTGAYTRFRFDFKATSGSITQLADLELFGSSVTSVALSPKSYSARGQVSNKQGIAKLFDRKTSTKWADASTSSWVKVELSASGILRRYTLTSAADTPAYDPASWTLSGSNDGTTWSVIETRTEQTWASRSRTREFVIPAASTRYSQYRFDFKVTSGTHMQLSELKLFGTP